MPETYAVHIPYWKAWLYALRILVREVSVTVELGPITIIIGNRGAAT